MRPDIRPVLLDHAVASQRLAIEAFGTPPTPLDPPTQETWPPPCSHPWGAWVDGELAAKATVRSFSSWFRGTAVPTAGVGGVTVAAEHRGAGLLRPLFDAALSEARARGEVVSTLYPSAAGIYRGLGYEIVGSYDEVTIPMSALAAVPRPTGTRVRRATAGDVPAVLAAYTSWAREQNGPLTREEAPFALADDELIGRAGTGTSLALDADGQVVGFARWDRGPGEARPGSIVVDDLIALTPDAARALWRVVGSFASVAGSVQVSTSGGWSGADPSRFVLGDHTGTTRSRPYMLRLLDVPGALDSARVAPISVQVPFAVVDPGTPELEGAWSLAVTDGAPRTLPDAGSGGPHDRPTFTSAGLAQSWAGSASTANLRLAGHLTGPTSHDAVWDALWAGRAVHVRDYF